MAKKKEPEPPRKKPGLIRRLLDAQEAAEDKARGRRRGQGQGRSMGPDETVEHSNKRITHSSFDLEAGPGSRRVRFQSCRCTEFDSDHLR